tara:strand:+ start:1223 stop:8536 length:7314 start_codon:yes stop_codon:yes gene_type:complete
MGIKQIVNKINDTLKPLATFTSPTQAGINIGTSVTEEQRQGFLESVKAGWEMSPDEFLWKAGDRFGNWGFNLIEAGAGGVYLAGKEILVDGLILRNIGHNGTPMWDATKAGQGLFEFVQEDILRDFVGLDFTEEGGVPEHTLFGPKGLGSAVIGVVPKEIRGVVRDPIGEAGQAWGVVMNQLVDNPLAIGFTMLSASGIGIDPVTQMRFIANGQMNPFVFFNADEWKQAYDVVYNEDRSAGQALAANIAAIDPFDRKAYNAIESQWWFSAISGTADFAKEIFLDPVERFTIGAGKFVKGASVVARVNDAGDLVKIYDFGIPKDYLRTATPSKTFVITEGQRGITVIRDKDFAIGKDLSNPNLPPPPRLETVDDVTKELARPKKVRHTYEQKLGIKASVTKLQAEGVANSKWFSDTYKAVIGDVPDKGLSLSFLKGGRKTVADNDILDRRATKFLQYAGRKLGKSLPSETAAALATAPSFPAAQRVLRNYMGDLSVKVEIDDIVRQADDAIDGQWKIDLENLNKKRDKIEARKNLIKEQKAKVGKLRNTISGKGKEVTKLENRKSRLLDKWKEVGTRVYEVTESDLLIKKGVQETKEQAQTRLRTNERNRIQTEIRNVEQEIENLLSSTMEDVEKLERNIRRNEAYVRNREKEFDIESADLDEMGKILTEVHWDHHFDFDNIVREAQQKKYAMDANGGHVSEVDAFELLTPSDNMTLNVLIDGIAEGIVNGSKVVARTGNGKIHRPLNIIHKRNMDRLKADSTRKIAEQRHWIPSTFEPGGFRQLRFITQRVPQGLIRFDDLGGQSYIMFERFLEEASKQNFGGRKIVKLDEVESFLGEWRRRADAGADFVEMGKFYQDVVKKLNKRAEDIFIEDGIKVYSKNSDGVARSRKIQKGDLDTWLQEATAGFINRVNPKNGNVKSMDRRPVNTVTADPEYLKDAGVRQRGRLASNDPRVQRILDEHGEDGVSMVLKDEYGINVLLFNMSPSQLSACAVVPRWDLLGVEYRKATGQYAGGLVGLRKPGNAVARQIASGTYRGMQNVWTSGKLLTPRWTARVITDEKMRMAAVFGMMKMLSSLQGGWTNYQKRFAANGLNFSEDGFEQALRDEFKESFPHITEIPVGPEARSAKVTLGEEALEGDPTFAMPQNVVYKPIDDAHIIDIVAHAQRELLLELNPYRKTKHVDLAPEKGSTFDDLSGMFTGVHSRSLDDITPQDIVDTFGNNRARELFELHDEEFRYFDSTTPAERINKWIEREKKIKPMKKRWDQIDKEIMEALSYAKNNPKKTIKIYRAVPPHVNDINAGDWVTVSRSYAEHFATNRAKTDFPDGSKIIEKEVSINEVVINKDRNQPIGRIYEQGYRPHSLNEYGDFVENAIKRNLEKHKSRVGKYKYGAMRGASVGARILLGSMVHPFVGLAWAGRHWRSRTKAMQQLVEKNAHVVLAQSYENAAIRLISERREFKTSLEGFSESAHKIKPEDLDEFKELAANINSRSERTRLALEILENKFGYAITNKDEIVSLFDKAATQWDKAGFPRLEVGNLSFENAYGSDQRWHRMVEEQLSSRRSTDGAVRGFVNAEKRIFEDEMSQGWNVYDLADARDGRYLNAWNNHYRQFSPTGPISQDLFDILYNDKLTWWDKKSKIAEVIDRSPKIRERLGINKYEGLEGDKELLELVAEDIIDEVNELLPPSLFGNLRAKAREGQDITWKDVEEVMLDHEWQKKIFGPESPLDRIKPEDVKHITDVSVLIKKIRSKDFYDSDRLIEGMSYPNFAKGRGPAYMASDQGALTRITKAAVDKGFENLGTMASDTLSRQPFFEASYAEYIIETIQPYRQADGTYNITPNDITRIETAARKHALQQTREVLYELAERTQFAEMVGFAMPFFNAYQEVIGRWAGLALENPHFVGKGTYFYSKDNYELPMLGVQQEENEWGNKAMVFRPANSHLAKLFTSLPFAKELGVAGKIVGKGIPGSGTVGDILETGVSLDRDGLLSMIQQTTPSFGPFITFPIREVMMGTGPLAGKPELEEVFGWLYPFGHPDGNFIERLTQELSPTWAKHGWYSTGWGAGNTQMYDRTLLEQIAMLDAQMRQNGIVPDYTDRKQFQDILHEAQIRTRNIGFLKVFGSTLVPVAVDDASPFVEMIQQYREWVEAYPYETYDNLADQMFFTAYGEEFFMLTASITNNKFNVEQSVSGWHTSKEFADFIERHPTLAPAVTNSLGGSVLDENNFSPIVRQMMLNDETIEYLNPENFVKNAEVKQGWAEWNAWLETPNPDLNAGSNEAAQDAPSPNDVRFSRSGVSSSLYAEENSDLQILFDAKEKELATKYPLWFESKQEYQSPTYMRDVIKGLEELLDNPSVGKKFDWYKDLVGEDGYLMERKAIQDLLELRGGLDGSSDLTAESNTDLLLRWKDIQTDYAEKPQNTNFYEKYFSNDLIQRNSWMD